MKASTISTFISDPPLFGRRSSPVAERHEIVAGRVMSTQVKCLRPVERAGVVYDLLKNCLRDLSNSRYSKRRVHYGTASAIAILCTLLQRRAFGPVILWTIGCEAEEDATVWGQDTFEPLVQWDTIERAYPNYPTIGSLK